MDGIDIETILKIVPPFAAVGTISYKLYRSKKKLTIQDI
jgi:hypothetical protein